MADYNFLVFSNPAEGCEDDYNRWYDDLHLGEVVAVPGFVAARRFKVAPTGGGEPPRHRYLAVYEIESDDVGATLGELAVRAGDGRLRMSDALGEVMTLLYEPMGARRTA
jgi:hypothetical protein